MNNMEYLKTMPIAVLGGGAVGKTCAADMKLAGREDLMMMASGSVCLMILLYWGSYLVLRRKF